MAGTPIPGYRTVGVVGHGVGGGAVSVSSLTGEPGIAVLVPSALQPRAEMLRSLRHPALPQILNVVEVPDGRIAVIMAPVTGPSLATLVAARQSLSPPEIGTVWRAIGGALGAMHSLGLVHGDVSPGNILISPEGPVLLDVIGHSGDEIGHRGHVAPEVLAGGSPVAASDVWSLAKALVWSCDDDPAVMGAVAHALEDDPLRRPGIGEFTDGARALGDAGAITIPTSAQLALSQVRAGAEETLLRPEQSRRFSVSQWVLAVVTLAVLAVLGRALLTPGEDAARQITPPPQEFAAATDSDVIAPPTESQRTGALELDDDQALAAVSELLTRRDDSLAAGDAVALAAVFVPGAQVLEQELALLNELQAQHIVLEGFGTDVKDVRVIRALGTRADVTAWTASRAHRRTESGVARDVLPGDWACVGISLTHVGEWRITAVTACENSTVESPSAHE